MIEKMVVVLVAVLWIVIVTVGLSVLFALPIQLLWNALLPTLFGLPKVTFLQAWGLNLLSGFLLKSHGGK